MGQFNYAKFLMNEGDYSVAAREFARFIENFPASPLMQDAQFGMAEAYFNSGLYRDAEEEFDLFLKNFEDSPFAVVAFVKMEEAQRKLKESELRLISPPRIYNGPDAGLRAVQVMLFEGKSYGEVEAEIKKLKGAGIDTVIARVFHNPGDRFYPVSAPKNKSGVYFSTGGAPVVDDILPQLVEISHRNGIRIFAWMTTRYADYGIEDKDELACKGYDISARKVVRCRGLDMFNDSAVSRLEAIYSDLAGYGVDGILFQDDLVLRHNEGFGPHAEALFKKDTGHGIDPESFYLRPQGAPEDAHVHYTPAFWEWASWKNRRLLAVAGRLRDAARKKNPRIKFAINLMYESVTNPPFALAWLSQNLDAAVKMGFDYYSIMAYHRQMGEELRKDPPEIAGMIEKMAEDAARTVGDPEKVLIKLQTIDWKTGEPLSDREVVGLIRDVLGVRGISLAVVPYRGNFPFYELGTKGELALLKQGMTRGIFLNPL